MEMCAAELEQAILLQNICVLYLTVLAYIAINYVLCNCLL